MPARSSTRNVPAPVATIIPATDLGSVEVAKSGNLYLLTDGRGDIRIDGRGLGLYDLDTRILSTSILRLNGSALTLLRGPYQDDGADTIQLTNPELRRNPLDKAAAGSDLARRDLSVTRTRHIDGDLRETVTVVNYAATPEDLVLELGLAVDMADIFEVRGYPRATRGTLHPIQLRGDRATFAYDGLDGVRRTTTVAAPGARLDPAEEADAWPGASVVATWHAQIAPGDRVTIQWTVSCEGDIEDASRTSSSAGRTRPRPAEESGFVAPRIQSDHELLDRTLARSLADLGTLRNDGPAEGEHYLAAGIPWFATLFGRDSLIASLETVAFMPSIAVATLEVLGRLQSTMDDPWHDAEPGKILHEMRVGEMARASETPHDAYYGSVDSTPLWLILLAETHAWTGDDALLDRLWPNALAALAWIDDSGDLDGDGFVEYQRRSKLGLVNQGWKDSGDAIRHLDGRPAEGRSPSPRSRAMSTPPAGRWRGWLATGASTSWPPGSTTRPWNSRPGSMPPSGCPKRGSMRWPSTGRSGRWRASPRTPARRCGPGSSRPSGRRCSPNACWHPTCSRAGACAPTRRGKWAITRSATTPAPSGRTTTRSSPPVSRRVGRRTRRTSWPAA